MDGAIAEVGIWNVALSDSDVALLAKGVSPLMVHPESLVFYAPLIGQYSPEIELRSARNLTLTGTPTQSAHPPIFYIPHRESPFHAVAVAGGGGTGANILAQQLGANGGRQMHQLLAT